MIFQNQMQSKIRPASIKHVSYSIVRVVRYSENALPLVLEKYLCASLALALAASRRVCCALLISLPSTAPWHAHARLWHTPHGISSIPLYFPNFPNNNFFFPLY